MTQNTSHAVMAQRNEPADSLDFFPTPPWATRALCEHVIPETTWLLSHATVWEAACGEGHMAEPLREYAREVIASDVHDYGYGEVRPALAQERNRCHWLITNPPFNEADKFARIGMHVARVGVALLVRSVWAEGAKRYETLFKETPPAIIAQFCERVAMTKGRWDPGASTATSYAWFVWLNDPFDKWRATKPTRFIWIPPGQKKALTKPQDIERFAAPDSFPSSPAPTLPNRDHASLKANTDTS